MDTNSFYSPIGNAWEERPPGHLKTDGVAGPDPATNFEKKGIDLNEQLVRNKHSTFFMRVNGTAMTGAGINHGDVVIVDRSLEPTDGRVVIALLNGEMLIRRLQILPDKKVRLVPETSKLAAIEVDVLSNFCVWGVVTYAIHIV
jgi:DNA polymerase V